MGPIGELGAAMDVVSAELRMLRVQAGLAREGITWVAALQRFKTENLRTVCAYSQRQSAVRAAGADQGDERAAGCVSAQRSCWYMRRLNSESDEPWSSHTHSCPPPPAVVLRIAHCLNPNLL